VSRNENKRKVMDALRVIVRELRLSARRAEERANVTGAQLFVLQRLGDLGVGSVNDLADRTMTDQSSVSVVVKRLVAAGLVMRKASPRDRRRLALSVSAAGKKLLAKTPEPTQVRLLDALGRMNASELRELTLGLDALVREMGIARTGAAMFFEDSAGQTERDGKRSGMRGKR
jgi:DNA-binding MarR family transcriptional regulator